MDHNLSQSEKDTVISFVCWILELTAVRSENGWKDVHYSSEQISNPNSNQNFKDESIYHQDSSVLNTLWLVLIIEWTALCSETLKTMPITKLKDFQIHLSIKALKMDEIHHRNIVMEFDYRMNWTEFRKRFKQWLLQFKKNF